MKIIYFFIEIISFYIITNSQTLQNRSINTCGELKLNNTSPTKKEDCKIHEKGKYCCFVKVTVGSSTLQYCSHLEGNLNNEVIKEFEKLINATSEPTIECNSNFYLKLSMFTEFFLFLFLLIF